MSMWKAFVVVAAAAAVWCVGGCGCGSDTDSLPADQNVAPKETAAADDVIGGGGKKELKAEESAAPSDARTD